MCGRYTEFAEPTTIAKKFMAKSPYEDLPKNYNAAPTQMLPVIVQNDEREIFMMQWGFTPLWDSKAKPLINAMSETIAEKASFKKSFSERRCLIPANGFYEWLATDKGKQPMYFTVNSQELFAFAGIWTTWKNAEGNSIQQFSIITCEPNELCKKVHRRMPVILKERDYEQYLSSKYSVEEHQRVLAPYPAADMTVREASKEVSNARNNYPELIPQN